MTRPEEIDAALALCRPLIEEWDKGRGYLEHQRHCEAGDALCRHINTLARLLRAANPPAGAERATETASVLPPHVCDGSGCCKEAEPATPAVGEDEALLALLEEAIGSLGPYRLDGVSDAIRAAMSRLRALLADVARLTEERDGLKNECDEWFKDRAGVEVDYLNMVHERDALRATLAAVRKVAGDYYVDGGLAAPDPCANEILGALEGNHEPRR